MCRSNRYFKDEKIHKDVNTGRAFQHMWKYIPNSQVHKWKHIAMLNKFFSLDSLIQVMMEIE